MTPAAQEAYDRYLMHCKETPKLCRCEPDGYGWIKSTVQYHEDGEHPWYTGECCPAGSTLWRLMLDRLDIVLTPYGETLTRGNYNPIGWYERSLLSFAGKHACCGGTLEGRIISLTHKALICKYCHLRVVIPNSVNTIADLREFLDKYNRTDHPGSQNLS